MKKIKFAIKFCKDNRVKIDSITKIMPYGCYKDVTKRYIKQLF